MIECSAALMEHIETEDGCLRTYSTKCVIRSRRSVVRCWSKEVGARDDKTEDSESAASEPRTGEELENVRKE